MMCFTENLDLLILDSFNSNYLFYFDYFISLLHHYLIFNCYIIINFMNPFFYLNLFSLIEIYCALVLNLQILD